MEIIIMVDVLAVSLTLVFSILSAPDSQFEAIKQVVNVKVSNPLSRIVWNNRVSDKSYRSSGQSMGDSLETLYARVQWVKLLEKNSSQINQLIDKGELIIESGTCKTKSNNVLTVQLLNYLASNFTPANPMRSPKNYPVKLDELLNKNKQGALF